MFSRKVFHACAVVNNIYLVRINIENFNVGSFEYIDDYLKRKDLVIRDIDIKTGLLDTDGVNKRSALFKTGTEPVETENKFKNGIPGY